MSVATVDEYIAAQPGEVQAALRQVRAAIRKSLPQATESLSYGMPAYKIGSARIVYFAAWRTHFSLYGATEPILAELKDELEPYKIEKGTIQFPYSRPVPVKVIGRIATLRALAVRRKVLY